MSIVGSHRRNGIDLKTASLIRNQGTPCLRKASGFVGASMANIIDSKLKFNQRGTFCCSDICGDLVYG